MTTETKTTKTRGQEFAADVAALLRARNPLLWIVTREEARAESLLFEAAKSAGYNFLTWDCGQGVAEFNNKVLRDVGSIAIDETLKVIGSATRDRTAWVLRDAPTWFRDPMVSRQTRNLARSLPTFKRDNAQAMIVLSPSGEVPPELAGHATVIELPLPDRAEIGAILDAAISALPEFGNDEAGKPDPSKPIRSVAAPNGIRDAAIDAAVGLSGEEAANCYARSIVTSRKVDPKLVAGEKKRVIARERVLEWFDPLPGGLDAVGGLENLKTWLSARSTAYSPAARAYGLPAPKGAVLVGVPGCGKSLFAKATATAWGVPLLRLDLGALKGKYVGESEGNIRKAFKVIEAIGRCVVWIDEIEKALAGSAPGAAADGGVSADALGSILSWMQERQGEAFVIATANNVEVLPPELLRKGRFDEIFFVDLPTFQERKAIAKATLRGVGKGETVDLDVVATVSETFTGAEIAALVPDAMFVAFADGARDVTTEDLTKAAKSVVPLAEQAKAKIDALREWARTKARRASAPEVVEAARPQLRAVDID